MMDRRAFLAASIAAGTSATFGTGTTRPKIAGIATAYFHNSHADLILGRFVEGYTLDDLGDRPAVDLASLYLDQRPENDKGVKLARDHGVRLSETVADALTLGTGRLAVDGVLIVAEHGRYPTSEIGSTIYPKRRLFEAVAKVFRDSKRSVPVFLDKHLADNWADAEWIANEAKALNVPMMAGSVLPAARRDPSIDTKLGEPLDQIIALSYHTLDAYGFHALEAIQCLAERRKGGETGVASVRCLTGNSVWKALEEGTIDRKTLDAAIARSPDCRAPLDQWPRQVEAPVLWIIRYRDGLRGFVLTLNNIIGAWSAAWRSSAGKIDATGFDTREVRPLMHFAAQVRGIESMIFTGQPAWPVERTLLTSGLLAALLTSKHKGGREVETPHLALRYEPGPDWKQPPPYPPARPLDGR